MNRLVYVFITLLFSTTNMSCNRVLCGPLNKDYQNLIDSANARFIDYFSVESIPCEFNYINLKLHTLNIDSTQIREAHKILYCMDKKLGWPTVLVYDSNGNYIISHSKNGKFYYQTGD